MEAHEIKVPDYRVEAFTKRMGGLAKKATKYAIEGFSCAFLGTEEKRVCPEPAFPGAKLPPESTWPVQVYHLYKVEAPVIQAGPWKFVATIDTATKVHTIHTAPGETCPVEFAEGDVRCDHCRTLRARKNSYVVRNVETGQYQMVGSNCLQDYLGVDPAVVARNFQFHLSLDSWSEHDGTGGVYAHHFESLERVLRATAAFALRKGFYSRSACDRIEASLPRDEYDMPIGRVPSPTSVLAWAWCTVRSGKEMREFKQFAGIEWSELFDGLEVDVETLVAEALAWARALNPRESEFNWNTYAILEEGKVWHRTLGTAAYMVGGAMRARDQLREQAKETEDKPASSYIGQPKERLTKTVRVESMRPLDGQYGVTYLYKMLTPEGDDVTWFASSDVLKVGTTYELTFTVKAHEEFRGTKQTVVTRAKPVCEVEAV